MMMEANISTEQELWIDTLKSKRKTRIILCMHGGLSPHLESITDIKNVSV
uniref:Uncharacterized protein n=1 Tax=Parascaris equorum TaxID=6256 RepID=A0A914S7B1_PAREQ